MAVHNTGVVLGAATLGYPIFRAICYSFHVVRMRRLDEHTFIGFENLARLSGDHLFIRSINVTVRFTLGTTIFAVALGLLVASVMSTRGIRGLVSIVIFAHVANRYIVAGLTQGAVKG